MRWQDERWVKVYTRDTGDWLFLSFDAQALFLMLLRKVDRTGHLALGKRGVDALPQILGHSEGESVTRVTGALLVLTQDGCVRIEGETLIIDNFEQAQESPASNAERQRRFKENHRVAKPKVTRGNADKRGNETGNQQSRVEQTRVDEKETLSAVPTAGGAVLPLLVQSDDQQVFQEWQRVMGKPASKFTPERRAAVRARLKEYPKERLFKAILGCKASPTHQGVNDRGTVYDDLELICRDATHLEKFESFADRPPTGPVRPRGPGAASGAVPVASAADFDASEREYQERTRKEAAP